MQQELARHRSRLFTATSQDAAHDRVPTGKVVWKARQAAGGLASPMSHEDKGRPYIVIAVGGHAGLGTRNRDYVQAYALPDMP